MTVIDDEVVSHDARREQLFVVSADMHIGPPLEVMREYCPQQHLDAYDEFTKKARSAPQVRELASSIDTDISRQQATFAGPWHYEWDARREKLDADGIAVEIVFHGSKNGEPVPFLEITDLFLPLPDVDFRDVAIEGMHIYNQWLADYCSVDPLRHIGLAQIPMWDIDAAVREVQWAKSAGLRGVNFPSPRAGIPSYNDPSYEPLWAVCEELDMPLNTHVTSGGADMSIYGTGPESGALYLSEVTWHARRAMWFMVMSGVFERHPGLKLVLTEQPGRWLPSVMQELDSLCKAPATSERMSQVMPRLASEYIRKSCFVGASFLSKEEADDAIAHEIDGNFMWGSDFPHHEGTYPHTMLSLRMALSHCTSNQIEGFLGMNAARVFGIDPQGLAEVTAAVGPRLEDIQQPPTDAELAIIERNEFLSLGFRTVGPFA